MAVLRPLPIVLFVAFVGPALAQDDPARAQDRREYAALKVRRDDAVAELAELWRRLDKPPPPGMDAASIAARRANAEQEVREGEAVLFEILDRCRELRGRLSEEGLSGETGGGAEFGQGKLAGRWTLRLDESAGFIETVQLGAFISGSFEVPGLGAGTFIGYGGSKIVLTLIDDEGDHVATLRGSLSGEDLIEGTWLRTDLAGGLPSQGDWTASR